jgi:hypothetical protein
VKDWDRNWAAVNKVVLSPNAVFEKSIFRHNRGRGLWFGIGNENCTVRNCLFLGNEDAVWNRDSVVRNNLIVCNRDVQTAGWFDLADGSHWPRALKERKRKDNRPAGAVPPAPDAPPCGDLERLAARPAGMSLEALNLDLSGNLYSTKPGQRLYQWGCLWDPHETYGALDEVQRALHLESGSRTAEVRLADRPSLDLRVPPDSSALKMNCYPKGGVPGVRLGVIQDR